MPMAEVEQTSAQEEHTFHHYTGNRIPWYVRLIWLLFWCFAVYYMVKYFLPTIQVEMVSPP
jgi:hypothetical protein